MAFSIGKDTLIFQASSQPILDELVKVEKRLQQFKQTVENQATPKLNLHTMLPSADMLAGLFAAVSVGFVAAATGAVAFFVAGVTRAMNESKTVLRMANQTGLSTESVAGIRYLSALKGVNPDELAGGFRHYQKTVGDAISGNETAINTFRRMGISMDELRGHNPDEIFERVTDAVAGMVDPFQRASVAHELLGRHGQDLMRIIGTQPGAFRAARDEAIAFGLGLDRVRTEQAASGVKELHEAYVRLQSILGGLFQVISAELGPILQAAAKQVNDWARSWVLNQESVKTFVRNAVIGIAQFYDAVVEAIAWIVGDGVPALLDSLRLVQATLSAMTVTASTLMSIMSTMTLGGSAGNEPDKKAKSIADNLRSAGGMAERLRKLFADMDAARDKGANAKPPVADVDITPLIEQRDRLEEALHFWGLTNDQIVQQKLLEHAVGDEQKRQIQLQIEQNRQLQLQLDARQRMQKMAEQGVQVHDQNQMPFEKLQEGLAQLNNLFSSGNLGRQDLGRGIAALFRQYDPGERKFASGITQGSAEEANILNHYQYGHQNESPADRIRRIQEDLLQEMREQTDIDRQLLEAYQQQNQPIVMGVI